MMNMWSKKHQGQKEKKEEERRKKHAKGETVKEKQRRRRRRRRERKREREAAAAHTVAHRGSEVIVLNLKFNFQRLNGVDDVAAQPGGG
jgi:hypothetical protein